MALPPPVSAESFGRLFTTPEQREALDRKRALNTLEAQHEPQESSIKVDGQVRRSSGKHTTWINGQAVTESARPEEAVFLPATKETDRVIVEFADYPSATVRVGETLNRETRETSDLIGNGKIIVRRAPTGTAR